MVVYCHYRKRSINYTQLQITPIAVSVSGAPPCARSIPAIIHRYIAGLERVQGGVHGALTVLHAVLDRQACSH